MNKIVFSMPVLAAILLTSIGINHIDAEEQTEKYEPVDVSEAIQQITPYVMMDDEGFIKFTVEEKYIPLHPHTILIASDYIEMQNSFRSQAQDNPDQKPQIDDELKNKFSKFIDDIQEKKEDDPNSDKSPLDSILPQAFAWGEVCGGAPWNPQPEPPVYELYTSQGAANFLLSNGYHLVPVYASGNYGDDYAKDTSAFGCSNEELRKQGVVTSTNNYNSQSPEPNPEILSYTAPIWWWDGYVLAWHIAN